MIPCLRKLPAKPLPNIKKVFNGEDSLAGAAYIFYRRQDGTDNWGQSKRLAAEDRTARDDFGRSVSIDGDHVIVGAERDDDKGTDAGAA